MKYKVFKYNLEEYGDAIDEGEHFSTFSNCIGRDSEGNFAVYRNQNNSILMHVRKFVINTDDEIFFGRIGKHSTEREVTVYDERKDISEETIVEDNDYPSSAFICDYSQKLIACQDNPEISAKSAIGRLQAIINHRQKKIFTATAFKQISNLKLATEHFSITEVSYEVRNVNPHTGDLGRILDENNKRDHIIRSIGRLQAKKNNPITLNGGVAEQIHELHQSGHADIGFKGTTPDDVEISVARTSAAPPSDAEGDPAHGGASAEAPELCIDFPRQPVPYPLPDEHIGRMVNIMRTFSKIANG